jgi:aminotransferase in exopolysaccharide biosynthesis
MFEKVVSFIKNVFGSEDKFIPLHEPKFASNEKQYLLDCLDSTFVSSVGQYVDRFEDQIKEYTRAKYAIATVNGTAALHIALLLAGVKRGDLVITQPLSFIATCNAISYLSAEPVFLDVDLETLGLSVHKMGEFLHTKTFRKDDGGCYHIATGKRIAACIPMHTFGHPTEIDSIVEICAQFGIPVVEDAAESLGSLYKGKQAGTFGLLGVYSFNGNKTITCGGGGMIVTDNDQLAKLAKHLTTQAKVSHPWEFVHDHIGFNYRLPNLNAALACAQMEQLDFFIKNKRELADIYRGFFVSTNLRFVNEPNNASSNYWLQAVLLESRIERDAFLNFANSRNVMTRPAWTLMNKLPMFQNCLCENIDNAQWIEDRLVNIPSSVRL